MSNKKKRRPFTQHVNIFDEAYLTHKRAIEISKAHIDIKPIKKCLK
jgi:hypothetical protein